MEETSGIKIGMNPYCRAITECFEKKQSALSLKKLDDSTCQFLSNMIQGMFIQFLVCKVTENFEISDDALEKQLMLVMTKILNDNFFVIFREKTHNNREVVYQLARRISKLEKNGNSRKKTETICRWITQTYTDYKCTGLIMQWICSTPEFEQIVFLAQIHRRVKGSREGLKLV